MDNLTLSQGGSFAFNSGALAEGTNNATIQIAAAINFTIDGVFKSKAITDNIAIAYTGQSGVYSLQNTYSNGSFVGGANGSTRLYCIFLDAAGAVTIEPGQVVDTAALAAGTVSLQFADAKRNKACIGALRVAATAGTTFTPGTTDLSASGITASFLNLSCVPGEPLTA